MFTLKGYGFGARNDTSKILALIKKDTIGYCNIITWADTMVVCDFPQLVNQNYITKVFSIKFKLFKRKPNITTKSTIRIESRTKSKSCISNTMAESALNSGVSMCTPKTSNEEKAQVLARLRVYNITTFPKDTFPISGTWTPEVGQLILYKGSDRASNDPKTYDFHGIITAVNIVGTTKNITVIVPEYSINGQCHLMHYITSTGTIIFKSNISKWVFFDDRRNEPYLYLK